MMGVGLTEAHAHHRIDLSANHARIDGSSPCAAPDPPRVFKQRVAHETVAPGARATAVARQHALSANVVFEWRRLHRLGLLPLPDGDDSAALLSVQVVDESASSTPKVDASATCELEIKLGERRIRVRGLSMACAAQLLRECLA